jgi:hypothetical protein
VQRVCDNVKRREEERKRSCCHMQQSVWTWSWVILLHVLFCKPFSISNTITLSRGCRRFCRTT